MASPCWWPARSSSPMRSSPRLAGRRARSAVVLPPSPLRPSVCETSVVERPCGSLTRLALSRPADRSQRQEPTSQAGRVRDKASWVADVACKLCGGASPPAAAGAQHLSPAALPPAWDWRSVIVAPTAPPLHFVTRVRNQFLPFWCGSCWAHAATAVLGSRWLIHANATWPPEGQAGIGEIICEPEPNPERYPTFLCLSSSWRQCFGEVLTSLCCESQTSRCSI